MIYRIDIQHFLSHAVDHFTRDELLHFEYAIISAGIASGGRLNNVTKINLLYPDADIVADYAADSNRDLLEKRYYEFLFPKDHNDLNIPRSDIVVAFYKTFINPLLNHNDIMILCDSTENVYIDVICKVLRKEYSIEVIDLNELFSKGRIGSIYIDRDKIHDKAVDIRREAAKKEQQYLETTRDGRQKLFDMMSKKEKVRKLKELGFQVTTKNTDEINKMLMEAWVEDE